MKTFLLGLVAVSSLVYGRGAYAHINLDFPMSSTTDQKGPSPCGGKGARKPTTFKAGEKIVVKWTETVPHPGHFRIAFDQDGMDDLKDPTSYTDIKNPAVAPILADGVHQHMAATPNKKWEFEITLPNVACTNCTLQVIQMMTDKRPFGGGDDFYYRCADIVLEAGSPADAGTPADGAPDSSGAAGAGGSGAGGSSGSGGSTGSGGASSSTGGNTGAGGASSGAGGATRSGGSGSARGGAAGSSAPRPSSGDSGGGCAVGGSDAGGAGALAVAAFLFLMARLGRRRRGEHL